MHNVWLVTSSISLVLSMQAEKALARLSRCSESSLILFATSTKISSASLVIILRQNILIYENMRKPILKQCIIKLY